MQTDYSAAAQHYPNQSTGGLKFIAAFLLGIFLVYAVQQHLITNAFSACMSLLFDQFSIKSSSIIADIVILIFIALALFGLWVLFINFTTLLIIAAACLLAGLLYLSSDDSKIKPVKFSDDTKSEKFVQPNHKFDGIGG